MFIDWEIQNVPKVRELIEIQLAFQLALIHFLFRKIDDRFFARLLWHQYAIAKALPLTTASIIRNETN